MRGPTAKEPHQRRGPNSREPAGETLGESDGPVRLIEEVQVPDPPPDVRLDYAAAALLEGIASPTAARKRRQAGRLLLNGLVPERAGEVRPGDRIGLLGALEVRVQSERTIPVLYKDEHLAVVHKPAGLRTTGAGRGTLVACLPGNLGPSAAKDALDHAHPVHRLDDRTAGLVLVARSGRAAVGLGRALQERRVQKRYEAVVLGRLEGSGRIDLPIDGRPAASRYAVLQHCPSRRFGWLSLVSLWPETGRTHQLRLHMAALGHPLLGDGEHDGGRDNVLNKGLWLFALELLFEHPCPIDVLAGGQPVGLAEGPETGKEAGDGESGRCEWAGQGPGGGPLLRVSLP